MTHPKASIWIRAYLPAFSDATLQTFARELTAGHVIDPLLCLVSIELGGEAQERFGGFLAVANDRCEGQCVPDDFYAWWFGADLAHAVAELAKAVEVELSRREDRLKMASQID